MEQLEARYAAPARICQPPAMIMALPAEQMDNL